MASVFDVAKFILEQQGEVTTMKLQKLVYYAQAWSLAWSGEPLFEEKIKAWREGPVVGTLHFEHRGRLAIQAKHLQLGSSQSLSDAQRATIGAVLVFYGKRDPEYLSKLTHEEDPWKMARGELAADATGNEEITRDSMRHFYSSVAGGRDYPRSPELLRQIAAGIEDARAGRTTSRGSFAQYLED
jgi:uncharacterized phage-associated protein